MLQITMIIALAHLIYCPFSKVEESFNLQATHDILYYKFNLSQYDHLEFPGVVPRTFIGPLFLSILSSPFVVLLQILEINKFYAQYTVRAVLALCVVGSLKVLSNTLEKQFGSRWLQWFVAVTITQSHFMFYLSRTLPNILALPLALLALDGWLNNNHKRFILFSGAAIIIFRFELALFLGLLLLHDLYYKRITFTGLLQIAVPGGIGLLLLTLVIDSIFWQRPLWPEGEVLWYNTVMNKSSDWGTSPFLWYFYSAIPRGLAASTFLVPVGFYLDHRVRKLVLSVLAFVFVYSFLPHKELRFIIYVFPFLNVAAATACHRIWENRNKTPIFHFLSLGVAGHLAVNVAFTLFLLSISGKNYPGGAAISHLHRLARNETFVCVHIANLAAQSGVSRFTQINQDWIYNKTENLEPHQLFDFTHLIVEGKSKFDSKIKPFSATYDNLYTIEAFHQVSFNYLTIPPVIIKTKPVLFILRRKENYKKLLEIQGNIDFDLKDNENIDDQRLTKNLDFDLKNNEISIDNTEDQKNVEQLPKKEEIFDDLRNLKPEIESAETDNNNNNPNVGNNENLLKPLKFEKLPRNKRFSDKVERKSLNSKKEAIHSSEQENIESDSVKETYKKHQNDAIEDEEISKNRSAKKIKYKSNRAEKEDSFDAKEFPKSTEPPVKRKKSLDDVKKIDEIPSVKKAIKDIVQSEQVQPEKQKIDEDNVNTNKQSVKDSIKKIKSKLSHEIKQNEEEIHEKIKTKESKSVPNVNKFKSHKSSKEIKAETETDYNKDEDTEEIKHKRKRALKQNIKDDNIKELHVEQKESLDNAQAEKSIDEIERKTNVEREIELKIDELRALLDRLEQEITGKQTTDSKDKQNDTEKQIEAKIEELSSQEDKLGNEKEKKRVKQSIKKIVQKYRRKKFENSEKTQFNDDDNDDIQNLDKEGATNEQSKEYVNKYETLEKVIEEEPASSNGIKYVKKDRRKKNFDDEDFSKTQFISESEGGKLNKDIEDFEEHINIISNQKSSEQLESLNGKETYSMETVEYVENPDKTVEDYNSNLDSIEFDKETQRGVFVELDVTVEQDKTNSISGEESLREDSGESI